jgi:NAD(P)-dependent dehydrogenase (short-subunit alcohol dehydrogenase family)
VLRFDGRVAVVTGAGRGIGRAHALLLARRGAQVVVNDLGGSVDGQGSDTGPAAEVVAEILAAGGEAVADGHDISTSEGGLALIGVALQRFGHIDIVVNNAGIMRWAALPEADEGDLRSHLDVHVLGTFHTTRAAWPHLVDQGYGRIVMTTSAGVFGLPKNLAYATAKGATIGMTRSLAIGGARHGIKVNALAPAAATRMGSTPAMVEPMAAHLVAPMAAFLAHEDCPVTGEIYAAGAGRFSRIVLASTQGWLAEGTAPTVEDLAEHWEAVNDTSNFTVPADLMAWSATFLSHLSD